MRVFCDQCQTIQFWFFFQYRIIDDYYNKTYDCCVFRYRFYQYSLSIYVFFASSILISQQRVISLIIIYNFLNIRSRDAITTNSSFYFFVRNSNRTRRETTMSSFDIEKKQSNEFFFFDKNDNFLVLSSKTFISINDLIDIIDLKLSQITQFSIDEQKFQKSIYDFVRVFFTIFFFSSRLLIKHSFKILVQQ